MKYRFLLLSSALFASASLLAQSSNLPFAPRELERSEEAGHSRMVNKGSRSSSYTDTLWYNDFSIPATWEVTGGGTSNGWKISTTQKTWYFANTSINSSSGGNYAVLVPDNPNSASLTSSQITTANAIDISAYTNQNLVLSYEKYGARFLDTLKVQVSNNGSTWVTLDDNTDFALLSTAGGAPTANPASRDLFIPSSIVNGDSLWIRFNWDADNTNQPGIGYGWYIDDVILFNVPQNDLFLELGAFFDTPRILYSWYYGAMPVSQASTDQITFSAAFSNRGSVDQPNSRLELNITGQETQNFVTSTTTSIAGTNVDTAATTTVYAPTSGPGTYSITWTVMSDSADEVPSNNSKTVDLVVTENDYSMAPLPVSSANIVGKGGQATSYKITQSYFFNADDTVTAIGVAFDSEWTQAGGIFSLTIIDEEGNDVAFASYKTIEECMITDDMIYFPLDNEVVLPAGAYDAAIETFSDSIFLVSCQDPIPPIEPTGTGSYFSRTTLLWNGGNYIEDMVYLTIRTKGNSGCSSNSFVIAEVTDTTETGSIDVISINGVDDCVYNVSWSGPSGFTSDDLNLTDLEEKGNYTITIVDGFGCVATSTFTVDGTVSVSEIGNSLEAKIYPNPATGVVNVEFNNALNEGVSVQVQTLKGELVFSKTFNSSNGVKSVDLSNLSKGVYLMKVSGSENSVVERIILQ